MRFSSVGVYDFSHLVCGRTAQLNFDHDGGSDMGLLDAFRRRSPQSGDVLASLITAAAANDNSALVRLVQEHEEIIRREFPRWQKLPADVAEDQAATARYANALVKIASTFEAAGDVSLMQELRGPADQNPIEELARTIEAADALIEANRAAEAVEMLNTLLGDMDHAQGTAVTRYRPMVLGRLGIAFHHTGDTRRAIEVTREARDLCAKAGDQEGIDAYTRNVESFGTFSLSSDATKATHTVVVREEGGRILTLDELANARGKLEWELRGGDFSIAPGAEALHQQGREAGARGHYDEAIALFTEANRLSPSWPYPVYDRAFTWLLKGDSGAALADYRKTLELAPDGFFTAEQSADMLAREAAGEFPSGLFATFTIDGPSLPADMRREAAEQIVAKSPGFAPAWDTLIDLTKEPLARLAVIERALAAASNRRTLATWRIKQAVTLNELGDRAAADTLLNQMTIDPLSTPGILAIIKLIRTTELTAARGGKKGT